MKLNYKKMIEEVDKLISDDFLSEMELRLLPKSKAITQKEAKVLIKRLLNVYSISHCVTCRACQTKYLSV